LPFWHRLTQVVLEMRPLNRCSSSSFLNDCLALLFIFSRFEYTRAASLFPCWPIFAWCSVNYHTLLILKENFSGQLAVVYRPNVLAVAQPTVSKNNAHTHTFNGLFFRTTWVGWYHTHTRLTALFLGLPGWAGTRKVKPVWILLKQETVSGSGISWAICKSPSCSRQITMPVPHHSFLQAGCPSCCPVHPGSPGQRAVKGVCECVLALLYAVTYHALLCIWCQNSTNPQ